jgi:hypothetical protein
MNGNWFPWSQDSTPNDYVLAWRHIHNIFSSKNINSTRLQWIWSVGNNDVGSYTAEEYWVGDNYTNWLGIDGYNLGSTQDWSSWTLPNEIFDNMIGRLRNLSSTKPLSINEYGSTSIHPKNVSNVPLKSEWLNQFCDYISNSQFKMASYFNVEQETDWAIFGGIHGDIVWNNFNAYSAYKNCLQSDEWIQPNSTNKRIITDEQFAGIF